ncbi:MAG TPA: hypothetical protein VK811_08995 [Candidatus Acidoferrum sp.]|jgi:hypothetical protein|nr:hypothetical protein [Candidatus Acidoferrum sp.]
MALDFSEPLMQWKEPSGFQQNKKQFYTLLSAYIIVTFLLLLAVEFLPTVPNEKIPTAIVFLPGIFLVGVLIGFFTRGTVAFRAEGIACAAGRSGGYIKYDEIENCRVQLRSYPSAQFYTLEFTIKDPNKFRIVGAIARVTLPQEVSLDSALDFLRNRGIRIIDRPEKLSST